MSRDYKKGGYVHLVRLHTGRSVFLTYCRDPEKLGWYAWRFDDTGREVTTRYFKTPNGALNAAAAERWGK